MKSPLRVAACQMRSTNDLRGNSRKIRAAVARAAGNGARLLVVPECALSGYFPAPDLDWSLLAAEEEHVRRALSRHGMWLALGTSTRHADGILNTAKLISPAGETAACYHKTELTESDRKVFAPGGSLDVAQVGEWKVGIQICFDMRFPENWRLLRMKGAELVLHLSYAAGSGAWKVPVLEGTVRCRAAENGFYVVSANGLEKPQMMTSSISDPDGKHLARAPLNRPAIIYAELDKAQVKDDFLRARRVDLWDTPRHRALLFGEGPAA